MLANGGDDRLEHRRWDGQVVRAVALGADVMVDLVEHVLQLLERVGVGVLAGDVAKVAHDALPLRAPIRCGLEDEVAELLVGQGRAGHPDHREGRRERPAAAQAGERRKDLAVGEISRSAEDHHGHRRRVPVGLEARGEGVGRVEDGRGSRVAHLVPLNPGPG